MEPDSYSKKSGNAPEYTHLGNIKREKYKVFNPLKIKGILRFSVPQTNSFLTQTIKKDVPFVPKHGLGHN